MKRFWAAAAVLLSLPCLSIAQTNATENASFPQSSCVSKASGFKNSLQARVYPRIDGTDTLVLFDPKGGFERSFQNMERYRLLAAKAMAVADGWAVFGVTEKGGKPIGFVVQYMLGDPDTKTCEVLPSSPEIALVNDMPPTILKQYAEMLANDDSGNEFAIRSRLAQMFTKNKEDENAPKIITDNAPLTVEPNFDFEKSTCKAPAPEFPRAIAVRVFPSLSNLTQLTLRDGMTEWKPDLSGVHSNTSASFLLYGARDAWAVYAMTPDNQFRVQYMAGDASGKSANCIKVPDKPVDVSIEGMALTAVSMYLQRLTGDNSGTGDELRAKLKKFVAGAAAPADSLGPSPLMHLPQPVYPFLAAMQLCDTNEDASFQDNFLTIEDIDGDGDDDYLFDMKGVRCVGKDGRDHGITGNHAAGLTILTTTKNGIEKVFDEPVFSAEIRRFKGYATAMISYEFSMNDHPRKYLIFKDGKVTKAKKPQNGGKVVYRFGIE
ncbi:MULTISPECIES: hypothetical protein [Mesorhizobium]|uniref:Uncharacterized protein n=2 Tax=Mesorhizobium TaxID=68287 RepID=A0AB38T369_9HYPH|nr:MULTISPECIES: hypothetical protein [Mesorhizobium]RUY52762.1 hypothetical protein EN981_10380 [Mesorhizobium sp. M7A.F.Ca.CA.001.13.2.1]MDF3212586.1 hypothetical protein [Mesorhizobium ciceri]RUY64845.1 hypothetical protein EN965_20200 [Mesorhizobium sp. M7A.F.Ca.CA.001.05.1.1]RUY70799.1 hypothetical protein EN980_07640 [Mesorhizobium sp. M7A.F.Ca.CA.001.13.1.1]RUZ06957.1 hypothetical protein EN955_13545 [Mesorhizobium sp. M7A.F.Ca.CA.001.04.2.1]